MTTSTISSSILQSLYSTAGQTKATPGSSTLATPTSASTLPVPVAATATTSTSGLSIEAATAKLNQVDPTLSSALQKFTGRSGHHHAHNEGVQKVPTSTSSTTVPTSTTGAQLDPPKGAPGDSFLMKFMQSQNPDLADSLFATSA